jgi:hypothetical protein
MTLLERKHPVNNTVKEPLGGPVCEKLLATTDGKGAVFSISAESRNAAYRCAKAAN